MRVSAILVATLSIAASAQAQVVRPGIFPVVVDANGRLVGSLVGLSQYPASYSFPQQNLAPLVALRVDSYTVVLIAGPQGLGSPDPIFATNPDAGISLYWESVDCTGQPLWVLGTGLAPLNSTPSALVIGTKLYVDDGPVQERMVRSTRSTLSEDDCASSPRFQETVYPTVPVRFLTDLSGRFQAPFRVK